MELRHGTVTSLASLTVLRSLWCTKSVMWRGVWGGESLGIVLVSSAGRMFTMDIWAEYWLTVSGQSGTDQWEGWNINCYLSGLIDIITYIIKTWLIISIILTWRLRVSHSIIFYQDVMQRTFYKQEPQCRGIVFSVICQVKIGHFLTFNGGPITPNEKPENYTLSLHLFD